MASKAPKTFRLELSTENVLALPEYSGVMRRLALRLAVTPEAIRRWGRIVPRSRVHELLALHPSLKRHVRRVPVRYKKVRHVVERYVKA